jgi:hypothetical protein
MERRTINVEESEAWEIGFNHGLKEGVDMNPFKKGFERYCYEKGYYAGVEKYCNEDQPEHENK